MKRLFELLIIAILLPATTGNAQQVESGRTQVSPPRGFNLAAPRVSGIATSPAPVSQLYFGGNEDQKEWNAAIDELRSADSESSKADAKNKIEKLLTAQYDESIESYEKYLDELSAKIAEMKKQVEKRKDARDEMVQLKLQMVVSEADGLGWPDDRQGLFPSLRFQNVPGVSSSSRRGGGGGLFGGPSPPTHETPVAPDRPDGGR